MCLKSFQKNRTCHYPTEWGWQKAQNSFASVWSELCNASAAYEELIRSVCKKSCHRRCTFLLQELKCTKYKHVADMNSKSHYLHLNYVSSIFIEFSNDFLKHNILDHWRIRIYPIRSHKMPPLCNLPNILFSVRFSDVALLVKMISRTFSSVWCLIWKDLEKMKINQQNPLKSCHFVF